MKTNKLFFSGITLGLSIASIVGLASIFKTKQYVAPFEIKENVEATDDVFSKDKPSIIGGYIGEKNLINKRLKNEEDNLIKPKIGYQMAYGTKDDGTKTVSIRYTAAISSLDVDSATWTRAMYEENGDAYSRLKEANKEVTTAYTGLTNNGKVTYATSVEDDLGNKPFNYYVVYTLLEIPLESYGTYYLDASLTITKNGKSITSTVGAVEINNQNMFSYERGTLDNLSFIEKDDRKLKVKGKDKNLLNNANIEIPSFANNGNGRYKVDEVEENGFFEFENLNKVIVPEGIKKINNYSFCFTSIQSILLPESLEEIGIHAFYNCTSLKEINIPNSIQKIGEEAFYNCNALTSEINLPSTLTDFGRSAFEYCTSLNTINVDCPTIPQYAFAYDEKTENLNIGPNVNEIINASFMGCNLNDIFIPSTVTSIGSYSFGMKLNSIIFVQDSKVAENYDYEWNRGCRTVYDVENTNTIEINEYKCVEKELEIVLIEYIGKDQNIIIPNEINGKKVVISSFLFRGNTNIESVEIQTQITKIPERMFSGCENLTKVIMPSIVEIIGMGAFGDCKKLSNMILPESLKEIQDHAFYNAIDSTSTISCMTLPNGIERIDYDAFAESGLNKIYIPETCIYVGNGAFGTTNLKYVYIEAKEIPDTWEPSWNYLIENKFMVGQTLSDFFN